MGEQRITTTKSSEIIKMKIYLQNKLEAACLVRMMQSTIVNSQPPIPEHGCFLIEFKTCYFIFSFVVKSFNTIGKV